MTALRRIAKNGFERVEDGFDAIFGPDWNPFYQLGALGWFFYWIVAVSGVYVYIVFDTGITQAYESVEYMTHEQWYAAGVMRSLHRYASDAMIVVMMLHLLREYALDRFRGARWFAWVTGVPLLWFVYACGISGYWLVWDKLAQYIAIVTTEWLDTLPFFGEPIARNFLHSATLSGRFFTLMVFIHIAVPLIMLFVMWIHIQRHARSKINPSPGLAVGSAIMLVVLSLVYPAYSQGPADLDKVPSVVGLDWFYLPAYPLLDMMPGIVLWVFFGLVTLLLVALPWLPPMRRRPAATVNLAQCNGCGRCFSDCPFSAITMEPRSDDTAFDVEAVVNADQCSSCGLCAGSCPTATPFRRTSNLMPGIDLPDSTIAELREKTLEAAAKLTGNDRVIVYGCRSGAPLEQLQDPGVAVLELPCIGNLPPSFLDFAITRNYADGVFLAGCREGDCYYRLGIQWTEQRLAGERDPQLRKRVPRERIAHCWAGPTQAKRQARELREFRAGLRELEPLQKSKPSRPAPAEKVETHG